MKQDDVCSNNAILPLTGEYVPAVVRLHLQYIGGGLIGLLGYDFALYVYNALIVSGNTFGFVAKKDGKVVGFIACSENIGEGYKRVLKSSLFKVMLLCLPKMFKFKTIKYAIETLVYPMRCKEDLPKAELLSIVVEEQCRGMAFGEKLVTAANKEFLRRGIPAYKVVVYEQFSSNIFYEKLGFAFVGKHCQHGSDDIHNIYLMKSDLGIH